MEALITFSILVLTSLVLILLWIKHQYTYWKDRGVNTTPYKYFWGHAKSAILQKEIVELQLKRMYLQMKSKGEKYFGFFSLFLPMFIPVDLDIIKSMLQSDFQHFTDRGLYSYEEIDPISAHLVSLQGERWKALRSRLTPAFSSGKVKMMFEALVSCTKGLDKVLEEGLGTTLDMKDISDRFTMDTIGSCAFGFDINSLENPQSDFLLNARRVFKRTLFINIKSFAVFILPRLMKFFKTKVTPDLVTDFYIEVVKNAIDYRKRNSVIRKDFMHILIELKDNGSIVDDGSSKTDLEKSVVNNSLTVEQMAAQTFVFFEGGYETSSATIAFCMFEMGQNLEMQRKVRGEIRRVLAKYDGQITYDAIAEMEYLDEIVNETMRKYPPLPTLFRVCTKHYIVPGTDLIIRKGTKSLIPTYAIHHDPEYYPDPEKFDPERFSRENKRSRPAFSFLPFGEGPRICIGMRFGLAQAKVGLAALLRGYEFTVNERTFPLEFDGQAISLKPKGGIWLDYTKIP